LIGGAYGGSGEPIAGAVENGIAALTSSLKAVVPRIVLVSDDDGISQQPVDCLLAPHATMTTCTSTRTPEQLRLNDDLADMAGYEGLHVMTTRGWFCFESQCPMVVGNTVVYRDLGHITSTYAQELAAPFRAAFRDAVGR
jgi:hypothetical protein